MQKYKDGLEIANRQLSELRTISSHQQTLMTFSYVKNALICAYTTVGKCLKGVFRDSCSQRLPALNVLTYAYIHKLASLCRPTQVQ